MSQLLPPIYAKNKTAIVKKILMAMKSGQMGRAAADIKILRAAEIDWPELAIIEKSLGAGKVLGESGAPFWANMVVKIMLKRALARKFNAPDPDRDSIIDKMDMDDPRFIHTVDTVKDIMLAGLKKLVRHDNLSYNIRGWEQLAKLYQAGFRWPELKGMIEDNKHSVIKALLTAIREDEAGEIESFPATFKSMGIDWPELDIIQRSLNAVSGEINESWSPYDSMPDPSVLDDKLSSLDRYIKQGNYAYACSTLGYIGNEEYLGPDDFDSKTVRRWRELLDKPNHKNGIMRCLLYNIKHLSDEDAQYNEKIVQALRWLTVSWSELDIIEHSLAIDKKKIKQAAQHQLDEAPAPDETEEILYQIEVALDGDTPEEAFELIEEHGLTFQNTPELKDQLDQLLDGAAMMAVGLLEDYELSNILTERFRHQLEEMGIPMPNQKIADTIDIYKKSIAKILIKMQNKRLISYMVEVMDEFVKHWGVNLYGYLPKDKVSVMKMLLHMMKDGEGQYAIQYIEILRAGGIDFPEFKVIERSMQADAALPSR
jgi:hypothetical protein